MHYSHTYRIENIGFIVLFIATLEHSILFQRMNIIIETRNQDYRIKRLKQ